MASATVVDDDGGAGEVFQAIKWGALFKTMQSNDLAVLSHGRELLASRARLSRESEPLRALAESARSEPARHVLEDGPAGAPHGTHWSGRTNPGRMKVDLGTEYSYESVRNLLHFVSAGATDLLATLNIVDTWRLATRFGLPRLAMICERKAETGVTPEEAVWAYEQSSRHGAEPLRKMLQDYICSHHRLCLAAAQEARDDAAAEFDRVDGTRLFHFSRYTKARGQHDDAKAAARAARAAADKRWYDKVLAKAADEKEHEHEQRERALKRIGGDLDVAKAAASKARAARDLAEHALRLVHRVWQEHLDEKAAQAAKLKNAKRNAGELFVRMALDMDHNFKVSAMERWKNVYIDCMIRGVKVWE
eukprot:g157.t1